MSNQPVVYLPSLAEMFRARDWVVAKWTTGEFDSQTAEGHLRSMAVKDASGSLWMLRPTHTGSVLVRVSPTGEVSMPMPEDFISPKRQSRIGNAAMLFGGVMWLIVAVTWIRGG